MHLFPVFSSAVLLCIQMVLIHIQIAMQQSAVLIAINLSVFFCKVAIAWFCRHLH